MRRAQNLEVGGPGDGRLDAQDAAGLVVHLDGVATHPVLDAHALGTVLEARGDFAGEVAVGLAAKEAHHVGALEVEHRVTGEARIDGAEGLRAREDDVGRPLGHVAKSLRVGIDF